MTTEWIITTVALGLTTLMSLSSIILPFIMKYKENKLKQKAQEIELINNAIDKLVNGYGEYRTNSAYNMNVLSAIYNTMFYCSQETKQKLQTLSESISKRNSYQISDTIFYDCIDSLQKEFKITKRTRKQRRLLK